MYGTVQRQRHKCTQLFAIYECVSSLTSAFQVCILVRFPSTVSKNEKVAPWDASI